MSPCLLKHRSKSPGRRRDVARQFWASVIPATLYTLDLWTAQISLLAFVVSVKGLPSGSVAQLAECSHGKRDTLGFSSSWATIFFLTCDIWWQCVGSQLGQRASISACLVVRNRMRNKSKQGGGCQKSTRWLSSSVEQSCAS